MKSQKSKNELIDTENGLVVAGGGRVMGGVQNEWRQPEDIRQAEK